MRKITLVGALLAAVALAGCSPAVALLPPPAAIAEKTTMDEKTSLAIEVLYRGLGAALEAAIDGGRLKGKAAIRADRLDAKLAFYVGIARAAYDAGNAESYTEALKKARPLADELTRIMQVRP